MQGHKMRCETCVDVTICRFVAVLALFVFFQLLVLIADFQVSTTHPSVPV